MHLNHRSLEADLSTAQARAVEVEAVCGELRGRCSAAEARVLEEKRRHTFALASGDAEAERVCSLSSSFKPFKLVGAAQLNILRCPYTPIFSLTLLHTQRRELERRVESLEVWAYIHSLPSL